MTTFPTPLRRLLAFLCPAVLVFTPGARLASSAEPQEQWDGFYLGTALPECGDWPWSSSAGANTSAEVDGTCLHLTDEGKAKGELRFYSRQWHADQAAGGVAEARLKVASCSGSSGVILMLADGAREVAVTFFPDRLELGGTGLSHPMDTTDAFHTYRVELTNTHVRCSVDGRQILDQPASIAKSAHQGRNVTGFGSCSSQATSEAWWEFVRYRTFASPVQLVPGAEQFVIYKEAGVYACFPGLIPLPDGVLFTSFGTRTKRSHIDRSGGSAAYESRDGGQTWQPTAKRVTNPLFLRKDGGVTYATAYGWREVPKERETEFREQGLTVRDVRPGIVAYLSGAYSSLRRGPETQDRRTPIPIPPRVSLMNYNSAAQCMTRQGVRLNAVYGPHDGQGESTSFALRSPDEGESWELATIAPPVQDAAEGEIGFGETALVELPDGRLLAMMRPDPDRHGYLWQASSQDGGKTWSAPAKTAIWGFPAHLLVLRDGRLLCSYGYRRAPMGIRACLSRDGGRTWDVEHEFVLRADGKRSGSDLGYPLTCELENGKLFTLYYFTCGDGITHIAATRWKLP